MMDATANTSISPTELHLLYVLLDSNLPTGGFVSSSGLESYAKHGFLSASTSYSTSSSPSSTTSHPIGQARPQPQPKSSPRTAEGLVAFTKAELANYTRTTCVFVRSAWACVDEALRESRDIHQGEAYTDHHVDDIAYSHSCSCRSDADADADRDIEGTVVRSLQGIDRWHDSTLLSHVGRRSSKAQGVALLTLYVKGLCEGAGTEWVGGGRDGIRDSDSTGEGEGVQVEDEGARAKMARARGIVDGFKRLIRRGESPGHLAVCFGIICAALGLPLERTIHLHLFLHARSLLSSAVRLNLIGPYASAQLLLHPFRALIEDEVRRFNLPPLGSTVTAAATVDVDVDVDGSAGRLGSGGKARLDRGRNAQVEDKEQEVHGVHEVHEVQDCSRSRAVDPWAWADEDELDRGPATTWPLGEILMSRHDLQHSRIFNS